LKEVKKREVRRGREEEKKKKKLPVIEAPGHAGFQKSSKEGEGRRGAYGKGKEIGRFLKTSCGISCT